MSIFDHTVGTLLEQGAVASETYRIGGGTVVVTIRYLEAVGVLAMSIWKGDEQLAYAELGNPTANLADEVRRVLSKR